VHQREREYVGELKTERERKRQREKETVCERVKDRERKNNAQYVLGERKKQCTICTGQVL
jgi:hypothetical protein